MSASSVGTIPVMRIRDLAKSFGPVHALCQVSLDLHAGQVHTLLGENGAGKSTLIKIMGGVLQPTAGSMELDGRPFSPASPTEAMQAGVSIIFQELSLSPNLSVAENIFAGREPSRFGFLQTRRLHDAAASLIERLGFRLDVRRPVRHMRLAERQLVEIAKGLSRPAKIVVMDEPTSSLSDNEADQLFRVVERLKQEGVAIVYISHRMDELMRISDTITVMRDGAHVSTQARAGTSIGSLITQMVGRPIDELYPPRTVPAPPPDTPSRLSVRGLTAPGLFRDISFEVRPGEVLGFFGLIGAGRSDVMKSLFGQQVVTEGQILLDGVAVAPRHPLEAIRLGIGFVTENRKEEGLVLQHSVERNMGAVRHAALAPSFGLAHPRLERDTAHTEVRRLAVKTASLATAAGALSGGNQQKIVLGKWLAVSPRVLILDEPTRGIDVGAKYEIYRIIRQLAAEGTVILLVSSELSEVLGLSDRIVVMHDKALAATLPSAGLTQEIVMTHAAGLATRSAA
ncbi:sugar ABC transporter ATP-binding protein [Lichenicola cladoniae]|uniref:Sugar ABC transporter ATP-binding protein n=1 Tax=Lichenicola cladoniae TaxID=1484109 RepID=A0A6M8HR83_9PROT|nr:sugar ABC transporter ATP-binding protein [Lichenicola cladoniae]NPD69145.1 sugar ABC transporter ATP-binding protein [Acetobacteraceae bacterium]QKE90964.1 sugar ABC transporter ATP-binding protein [Lichenicola cladoniae]